MSKLNSNTCAWTPPFRLGLTCTEIPITKIAWSQDSHILILGIHIAEKIVFILQQGPSIFAMNSGIYIEMGWAHFARNLGLHIVTGPMSFYYKPRQIQSMDSPLPRGNEVMERGIGHLSSCRPLLASNFQDYESGSLNIEEVWILQLVSQWHRLPSPWQQNRLAIK